MEYIAVLCKPFAGSHVRDVLISLLADIGFESFVENDDGTLSAYMQAGQFSNSIHESLKSGQFKTFLQEFSVEKFADQNWNAQWESDYQPVLIDKRCMVRAPFHKAPGNVEYDIVIMPKMSFGTAHHETTKMMVRYLLELEVAGCSLLDMGSGTGVLAILAAMKKAGPVTAIDNDEWAFENAKENVIANNHADIEVLLGDKALLEGRRFDIILANINRNILLADLPSYASCLVPGGKMILSGFYDSDLPVITQRATELGFRFISSKEENKWTSARYTL